MGFFNRTHDARVETLASSGQAPRVMRSVPLRVRQGGRSNPDALQQAGHVSLSKATVSLQKKVVEIIDAWFDAQVELYVDYSSSMEWPERQYYSLGHMQVLAERSLAAGLELDADGTVPVTAFSRVLVGSTDVTLDTYRGVIDREVVRKYDMGGTAYAPIFRDVLTRAKVTDYPIIVVVVTDGEPNDPDDTKAVLSELSQYPVFVKFLSLESNTFLDELDDNIGVPMLVDNVSCEAFDGEKFPKLAQLTHDQFAQAFFEEMDVWMNRALGEGILYEQ